MKRLEAWLIVAFLLTAARAARAETSPSCASLTDSGESSLCAKLAADQAQQYITDLIGAQKAGKTRQAVTDDYASRFQTQQQSTQQTGGGQTLPVNAAGPAMQQAQAAGGCQNGAYENGQCPTPVGAGNKSPADKKLSQGPADEGGTADANGLHTQAPPLPYPKDEPSSGKPFKLSDNQKSGMFAGAWGLLLFGMLGGLGLGIVGAIVAGGIGFGAAKMNSDDGGDSKKSSSHHDGGGGRDHAEHHEDHHPDTGRMGSVMGGGFGGT